MPRIFLFLAACTVGCASPGPPLPPSLNLPAVIETSGFTATRVGDAVQLHWTVPERTTDKLVIKGPITAVICRDVPSSSPARPGKPAPCPAVHREQVAPGPTDAIDSLPNALSTGPPRVVAYRVELLNAAGRTAGPSAEVFAAAGAAPDPVQNFSGANAKDGALLRWRAQPGSSEAVELERTTVAGPPPTASSQQKSSAPAGLPGQKQPAVERFRAGAADTAPSDPGGTLDRTARIGYTYTYTAQRVRTAQLDGRDYQLRSAPSPVVTVTVRDTFPPAVPTGLVAVPGFATQAAAQHPVIDLSWEPDVELRVAGYRVYRREGDTGAWQRLTADPVTVPSYRDATVTAGHTYTYRVTAVSDAGNESNPSPEVTETAPTP